MLKMSLKKGFQEVLAQATRMDTIILKSLDKDNL